MVTATRGFLCPTYVLFSDDHKHAAQSALMMV